MKRILEHAKVALKNALEPLSAIRPRHWAALSVTISGRDRSLKEPTPQHLRAAIEWLKLAQDASGTGGVSWGYRTRARVRSGKKLGWESAYPETSGYILETLIQFGRAHGDDDAMRRARRIADWEVGIQRDDGGIQGGTIGALPVESSTFVTGQVLRGLVQAYREFGVGGYLQSAARAAQFLAARLDGEGRFLKGYSHFCAPGPKAYEVCSGWGIYLAGEILGDQDLMAKGKKTATFALSCQLPNGWFQQNDLDFHDRPLTHTIGYTLQGLLEIGQLSKETCFLESVHRTLIRIKSLVSHDGFLAGRWTRDWRPTVNWCCLSGSCQLALVCFHMHRFFPDDEFHQLGTKLLTFVARTQRLAGHNRAQVGGIQGSYPFSGEYGPFCYLNWATKFYADALLEWFHTQVDRDRSEPAAKLSMI